MDRQAQSDLKMEAMQAAIIQDVQREMGEVKSKLVATQEQASQAAATAMQALLHSQGVVARVEEQAAIQNVTEEILREELQQARLDMQRRVEAVVESSRVCVTARKGSRLSIREQLQQLTASTPGCPLYRILMEIRDRAAPSAQP